LSRREVENFDRLPERNVKQIVKAFLASEAWNTDVAIGATSPADIEARRGIHRWIIEVKGSEYLNPPIADSFVSILGRVLQRMNDPKCKYSVALPDAKPFHRLWERLPALAKDRTGITALFVNPAGSVTERAR
jgi:hypothetical protein